MTKSKVITFSNIRFIVTQDNIWLVRESVMDMFGYGSGDYYVSPDCKFVLNKDGKVISPVVGLVDHIELTEDIHGDAMQVHLINEAGIMQMEPSSWDCNGRTMDSFLKDEVIPRLHEHQKDFMEDKKMAKELVSVVNNQIVTDSRKVAGTFGKEHSKVIRSIENIITEAKNGLSENSAQNCAQSFFYETTYKDGSGKSNKMYLMNRDGFSLLVMGFTGAKAMQWKIKYIEAFNTMEKQLKSLASVDSYMIGDPIERAKAWIKEEERRIALAEKVNVLEPLAGQTIKYIEHNHLMKFRELSKELKIKEPVLRMIITDILHWVYKSGKRYVPYKSTIQSGFMAAYDYMNEKTGHTGVSYGYTIDARMKIEQVYADLQDKISA